MTNKYIVGIVIVLAFAAGRYLTPTKIEVKTVEVERKQTETERAKHKETTTVTKELPDGTKETTTKITEDSNTHRDSTTVKDSQTQTTKEYGGSRTSLYALGGINVTTGLPTYGGGASRQVLGPISAGAFFLTPGIVGVSLGLEF